MSWLSTGLKKAIGGPLTLRTLAGRATGVASLATGGLGGAAIAAGTSLIARPKGPKALAPPIFTGSGPGIDFGDVTSLIQRMVPGGRTGAGRVAIGPDGKCPQGYHLNKSRSAQGHPARSYCVRNRSMNYWNGRAATRAARRLDGSIKQLKRGFRIQGRTVGKVTPKRGKR